MTAPTKVAAFHAEYDHHTNDRVRLFEAVRTAVPRTASVLYAGSYVDIAPSVWFDNVTYVDVDRRAARWFGEHQQVSELIATKRTAAGVVSTTDVAFRFHHLDYQNDLPVADGSIDLLVSLYAGFISEHCSRYLRPGGLLLVNSSHGDADMAALSPANQLVGVLISAEGHYRLSTTNLEQYLIPKRGKRPTVAELHASNRGVGHTTSAFAYLFKRGG